MNTKYLTKQRLIALNSKAAKAGGNYIEPTFLQSVPAKFRYPVCLAFPVPVERGWVRCWVTIGADVPPVLENLHHLLLDLPAEVFEKLPVACC